MFTAPRLRLRPDLGMDPGHGSRHHRLAGPCSASNPRTSDSITTLRIQRVWLRRLSPRSRRRAPLGATAAGAGSHPKRARFIAAQGSSVHSQSGPPPPPMDSQRPGTRPRRPVQRAYQPLRGGADDMSANEGLADLVRHDDHGKRLAFQSVSEPGAGYAQLSSRAAALLGRQRSDRLVLAVM